MTTSAKADWKEAEWRLPFLAALPVSARPSIHVEEVDAGELLFRTGAAPTSMFIVLTGEVLLIRSSRSGGEIVLQRARRGILADASLDQAAYQCDAVASVPSCEALHPSIDASGARVPHLSQRPVESFVRKTKFGCPLLFCLRERHRPVLSLGLKIVYDAIGSAFETKSLALCAQPA
jgi:Cyclic nucleotide-binding domain